MMRLKPVYQPDIKQELTALGYLDLENTPSEIYRKLPVLNPGDYEKANFEIAIREQLSLNTSINEIIRNFAMACFYTLKIGFRNGNVIEFFKVLGSSADDLKLELEDRRNSTKTLIDFFDWLVKHQTEMRSIKTQIFLIKDLVNSWETE